ncbi:hypothetical protein GCM10023191_063270 [Actinoallomurus oryzae]|uniref:Uncharacterized protein n=1 Tax=Actinoallomurus oryzae TaxID=502180 RepID=A0ABP8QPB4_9ACTN
MGQKHSLFPNSLYIKREEFEIKGENCPTGAKNCPSGYRSKIRPVLAASVGREPGGVMPTK